jgi:serine/threonine protein kinase
MTDITAFTQDQILAIPLTAPEKLFTGDSHEAKLEFRRLRSKWHPDTNRVDPGVMSHINALYDKAMDLLSSGRWSVFGKLEIKATNGKEYVFKYLKAEAFDLGMTYVGEHFVLYFIQDDYADLVRIAQDHMGRFKFADGKLKAEHEKSLPKLTQLIQVKAGYYIVIQKDPAYLRLSDVLGHFGGKLDPKHAAWILSRLYNLNCYLKLAGLVHSDISPQNCFINPGQHYLALLGGWWFARKDGERLIALPQRTIKYGPDLPADKRAVSLTNSELIKAAGRELLGDIIGSRLPTMGYPKALVNWLRTPAENIPAWDEYGVWQDQILKASFGARKFVELKLESKDIYTR